MGEYAVLAGIMILSLLVGFGTAIYVYAHHWLKLGDDEINQAVKGHIRQHLKLMNLIFMVAVIIGIDKYLTLVKGLTFPALSMVSFSFAGVILTFLCLHLMKELKGENQWT